MALQVDDLDGEEFKLYLSEDQDSYVVVRVDFQPITAEQNVGTSIFGREWSAISSSSNGEAPSRQGSTASDGSSSQVLQNVGLISDA